MNGFEAPTSDIGNNCSAKWATTIYQVLLTNKWMIEMKKRQLPTRIDWTIFDFEETL